MLKGNTATDYANPKDRERWKTALEKNGVLEDFENKFLRQDGNVIWVKDSARVVKDNKGRVLYYEGALVDFTERKKTEEELRKSEERFKLIFEYAPDAYYLNDLKGNFIDGNKAAENITGYKREELIGGSFLKLKILSLDQLPKAAKLLAKNAMGMATGPDEFILKRKSGDKVAVEISTHPVKFDNRTVVLGIARDITERKRAGEALRESEEKYRTVVENAAEAILIAQDGMLKFVNRIASEMTGYSEQELHSSPFLEFVHPDDRDMVGERYLRRLKGDMTLSRYAFRLINKDGSIKWVEIDAVLVAWEGKPATLNFLSDITERKKAEKKLGETLSSLRNALGGIIQVLSATIEKRDPYTAGHQRRVADLARAIGQEMGITADRVEGLRIAGIIHDIGKVSIPAEILSKPTRLTEIEYKLIQSHPEVGHDILRDIDFAWPLAEMVLQHHERMNGSGYPNQLKGEEILLEARILAVSDVVEAMASHRPYRPALGIEAALEEIEKNKGVFYDPDVVSACLTLFREKGFEFK
jgi:PAS domain S-box-containing protein